MEFSKLGHHCDVCLQKDFLPFECLGCRKWFCLAHRTTISHECKPIETPIEISIIKPKRKKCAIKRCKKKDIVDIDCRNCGKHFCLQHRYTFTHACDKSLITEAKIEPYVEAIKEPIKEAIKEPIKEPTENPIEKPIEEPIKELEEGLELISINEPEIISMKELEIKLKRIFIKDDDKKEQQNEGQSKKQKVKKLEN